MKGGGYDEFLCIQMGYISTPEISTLKLQLC